MIPRKPKLIRIPPDIENADIRKMTVEQLKQYFDRLFTLIEKSLPKPPAVTSNKDISDSAPQHTPEYTQAIKSIYDNSQQATIK